MKQMRGNLYIRKLEIVDDSDNVIHKVKNVPVKKGIHDALRIIEHKDSKKTLKRILLDFRNYLDKDFKALFYMEDEDNVKKNKET